MLEELSDLADEIAALQAYAVRCGDPAVVAIIAPLIGPLIEAVDELAEQEGMLSGVMPSWSESGSAP